MKYRGAAVTSLLICLLTAGWVPVSAQRLMGQTHASMEARSASSPQAVTPTKGIVVGTSPSYFAGDNATSVLGQGSLVGGGAGTAATSQWNTHGVSVDVNGGVYLADTSNNRVLFYPAGSTVSTRVYGQPDFTSSGYATSATALHAPLAVTVDITGNVYVADSGNNRIVYYPSGSTTATRVYGQPDMISSGVAPTAATSFYTPAGMSVDASGGLYVADAYNNRVLYFPSGSTTATRVYGQGSMTTSAGGSSSTALANPFGVTVDSAGNVYVADSGNNRVVYYPSGSTTATRVYGQPDFVSNGSGTSATALNYPYTLTLDASGNLYVADSSNARILYFPAGSTTATRVYGQPDMVSGGSSTSATGLNYPVGVAVDASGNVYVADSSNNRIVYYPSGSTTATRVYGQPDFTSSGAGTSSHSFSYATGLAHDSAGGFYVADFNNNRVLYFPAGVSTATRVYGQSTLTGSTYGTSATTLYHPFGLTLDSTGNLYVADSSNNRVLFYPVGSTTATRVYGQASMTTSGGGSSASTLSYPVGVAVDASGDVYITDLNNNRILYYPSGSTTATRVYGQSTLTSNTSGTSASTLNTPYSAAVDASGGLYVADWSNNRVLYYPSGSTTATRVYGQSTLTSSSSGTSTTALNRPSVVTVDSSGNLYVADDSNNRVLYYPAGSTTATRAYGQPDMVSSTAGASASTINDPEGGLVVDPDGTLYVSDSGNNRVLIFQQTLTTVPTTLTAGGTFTASLAGFAPTSVVTLTGDLATAPITLTTSSTGTYTQSSGLSVPTSPGVHTLTASDADGQARTITMTVPSPTSTPTNTPTKTPTNTPTNTPIATPTNTPTNTPSPTTVPSSPRPVTSTEVVVEKIKPSTTVVIRPTTRSGDVPIAVDVHTTPRGTVKVTLEFQIHTYKMAGTRGQRTRRPVTIHLYEKTVHLSADQSGTLKETLILGYRPRTKIHGSLIVTVMTVQGVTTYKAGLTVLPPQTKHKAVRH